MRWFSDFPMIHSVPELLKCSSEPDKPRALTQCAHTHTHTNTLSLTGQEGSVRDIQEFLISATRANTCALCLKRNDKWGAIGWLTKPACKKKKKKNESEMNPSGVLSAECDPCLTAEYHNWMKVKVRFSRLFHYWMKPRYAKVLNLVWLPFL